MAITLLGLIAASCTKEAQPSAIDGQWQLETKAGLPADNEVYIDFKIDQFKIYQNLGTHSYRIYTGTFNADNNVLTGKYNDGSSLAADYDYILEGNNLTLIPVGDELGAGQQTFTRVEIPAEVIDNALPALATRSSLATHATELRPL